MVERLNQGTELTRRNALRRFGAGGALVTTGLFGLSTTASASHTDEPVIELPDEQVAMDHPRFNAVINIERAHLPDGGYINVTNADEDGPGIQGQTIIRLPAGHFKRAPIVVQVSPAEGTYDVVATLSRDEDGEDLYVDDDGVISAVGTVTFG